MKKFSTIPLLLILAFSLTMSGCNKGEDGAVLAKVNRGTITASDFKKQIEELAPQMQQAILADPKARKEFLEDLIGIEVVIQEAKRQGLDKDAEYKKRQEQLKKELERRVQEEAKNDLFNSLLKKELGDKMSKVTPPSDKEVQDYFTQNKDKIFKAAGKQVSLKDIGQQLKLRMTQEKRRDLYLEYAKGLKAKAKISVDDKAMDTAMAELNKPADLSNLTVTKVPAAGKEETKK
ncbi:MAG: SurA N-terminal domain-containing protein [Nitrospirae bacterium]|nr:SurA N-terminal domain-containing protein [Nitrospirota bacterium]